MTLKPSKVFQAKIGTAVFLLLFTLAVGLTVLPAVATPTPTQQTQLSTSPPQQLFQQGETFYQSGRFAEAVTVLQQAARGFQTQGEDLKQAATLSNLALAAQQLGLWQEAKAAIAKSLALLEPSRGTAEQERRAVLAQTLDIQGGIQLATGQPDMALQIWQRSTQLHTQLQDAGGMVRGRVNQAKALQINGFYRRALDILTELSQSLQTQPESLTKAATLRSLGDALQLTGDLKKSRQVLQESLEIAQRLQSPADISAAQLSLGNTARAQQETQSAIAFYQQAAASAPDRLGGNSSKHQPTQPIVYA